MMAEPCETAKCGAEERLLLCCEASVCMFLLLCLRIFRCPRGYSPCLLRLARAAWSCAGAMDSTEPPAPAPDVEGSPSLRGAAKKRLAMMAKLSKEKLLRNYSWSKAQENRLCEAWKEHLPLHR